ncbi:hypothetical protein AGMMS50276_09380 [Synergistales bacterium]|nr:hypothetical protein AGMMS50276_09380 [Synergistales bacterium]
MRILRIAFLVLSLLAFPVASEAANSDIVQLGVMEFVSKANGVSPMEADAIMDVFTLTLTNSKSIAVVERARLDLIAREQKLAMSGLVDVNTAAEIGRIAGVQYMLLGAVTELSRHTSGGTVPLPFLGGVAIGGEKQEVRVTINARIVDVTTSEVCLAISETGSSSSSSGGITMQGFAYIEKEFGGLEARAIADAVNRLSHEIREFLGGENSYVIEVKDKNHVRIDVGSTMGAKKGSLYLVYAEGQAIRNMSGEVIDREKIPLAALKVSNAESAHSVCELVSKGGKVDNIRRGDRIEPITSAEVKKMKFAATRPSSSGGTRETPRMAQTTTRPVASRSTTSPARTPSTPPPAAPKPTPAMTTQPTPTKPQPSTRPVETQKQETTMPSLRNEPKGNGQWVDWGESVPRTDKKTEREDIISEPAPGSGVKFTTKKGWYGRWVYTIKKPLRTLNHWEIEVYIDRLDNGGSGVFFGSDNPSMYMAAYVSGTKIFLINYVGKSDYTKVIAEAPLKQSQYKQGPMVLKVELFRNTNTVKCYVNDDECLNYDVTKKQFKIPEIENYGFFGGSSKSTFKTVSIFKKIEVRVGN